MLQSYSNVQLIVCCITLSLYTALITYSTLAEHEAAPHRRRPLHKVMAEGRGFRGRGDRLFLSFAELTPTVVDGVFTSLADIALWANPEVRNNYNTCRTVKRVMNGEEHHVRKTLYEHKQLVLDSPDELRDRDIILAGCVYSLQHKLSMQQVLSPSDVTVLLNSYRELGCAVLSGMAGAVVDTTAAAVAHHQPPPPSVVARRITTL
jgi:hypothetical protein